VSYPPTLNKNQFHSKPLHFSDVSKGVGDTSSLKQTRSKTWDPQALTYNTNGKEQEERSKEKREIMKERRTDKW
jgi:hypothetical protein